MERANKTLQDRLVKELRLRDISTIEAANAYVPEFIDDYNKRFAKPPISDVDAHRPLQPHEGLKRSLCFKQDRTVTNNLTVQHDRIMYLLEDTEENRSLRRQRIQLHEYPDGSIELFHQGRVLNFRKAYDRTASEVQGSIVPNKRIDEALSFIREKQKLRPINRSVRAPTKRHLGIIPPNTKKKATG